MLVVHNVSLICFITLCFSIQYTFMLGRHCVHKQVVHCVTSTVESGSCDKIKTASSFNANKHRKTPCRVLESKWFINYNIFITKYKNMSHADRSPTYTIIHSTQHVPLSQYTKQSRISRTFKVILCASEHIFSIVRYCFRSVKQL